LGPSSILFQYLNLRPRSSRSSLAKPEIFGRPLMDDQVNRNAWTIDANYWDSVIQQLNSQRESVNDGAPLRAIGGEDPDCVRTCRGLSCPHLSSDLGSSPSPPLMHPYEASRIMGVPASQRNPLPLHAVWPNNDKPTTGRIATDQVKNVGEHSQWKRIVHHAIPITSRLSKSVTFVNSPQDARWRQDENKSSPSTWTRRPTSIRARTA